MNDANPTNSEQRLISQLPEGDCPHEHLSAWRGVGDNELDSIECDDCGAEAYSPTYVARIEEARKHPERGISLDDYLKEKGQ